MNTVFLSKDFLIGSVVMLLQITVGLIFIMLALDVASAARSAVKNWWLRRRGGEAQHIMHALQQLKSARSMVDYEIVKLERWVGEYGTSFPSRANPESGATPAAADRVTR